MKTIFGFRGLSLQTGLTIHANMLNVDETVQ